MAAEFKLPNKKAVVFWPIGTGDSTTLVLIPNEIAMQIDLRHLEKADDPDEPEWPIIDHLVKILPKKNNRPYLALFVLTHPDKDHIQGFAELLKKVDIGEITLTTPFKHLQLFPKRVRIRVSVHSVHLSTFRRETASSER